MVRESKLDEIRTSIGVGVWNRQTDETRRQLSAYVAGLNQEPPKQIQLSQDLLEFLSLFLRCFKADTAKFLLLAEGKKVSYQQYKEFGVRKMPPTKFTVFGPDDQIQIHKMPVHYGTSPESYIELVFVRGTSFDLNSLPAEDAQLALKNGKVVDLRKK